MVVIDEPRKHIAPCEDAIREIGRVIVLLSVEAQNLLAREGARDLIAVGLGFDRPQNLPAEISDVL